MKLANRPSRSSIFTVPYSHLAVLNGNPALRGWPATAERWNAREKSTASPLLLCCQLSMIAVNDVNNEV